MRPGWNCLASGCHFPDGRAPPPDWGAGGTIYERFDAHAHQGIEGVAVTLRDARGIEVRLLTNAAGNFYTAEPLEGPIDVTLERAAAQSRCRRPPRRARATSATPSPPSRRGLRAASTPRELALTSERGGAHHQSARIEVEHKHAHRADSRSR